ncbi:MAG TPA: hypothetical protein VKN82_05610 [Desulfohalobiaceae bacterium]|nr:hypothetical protein [Desulfohalobiaceae bacterium]
MDIIIGDIKAVQKEPHSSSNFKKSISKEAVQRERRKNKKDRRKNVRDGVIVHLSTQKDRRSGRDRRKTG